MKLLFGSAVVACVVAAVQGFQPASLSVVQKLSRHGPIVFSSDDQATGDVAVQVAQRRIDEMVKGNKVLLFMKGNKMFPQCGFSNTAVQVLMAVGAEFEVFDVFTDEAIRQGIKTYSNWPTIPQLYIDGEFVGGSDIMIEMYQNGELQSMVGAGEE
mmetsp:Transcript_7633/g.21790  ORF Transcript_7633/g.21790 Transcript_7633/m.21790 type:complete len:156 (-) Transcript_7633:324-791(-)